MQLGGEWGQRWWLAGLVCALLLVAGCAATKGGASEEVKSWGPCDPSARANGTFICYQR